MFAMTYTEKDLAVEALRRAADAIGYAAFGLSDQQSRLTPCCSALSVGGLIKHATFALRFEAAKLAGDPALMAADDEAFEAATQEFYASFALTAEETLEAALGAFLQARDQVLAMFQAADFDAHVTMPPAPWADLFEPYQVTTRCLAADLLVELMRHAGHADIIREQIDGADSDGLRAAAQGHPGNDFITPWVPGSSTP